jgi:hypothetical protein
MDFIKIKSYFFRCFRSDEMKFWPGPHLCSLCQNFVSTLLHRRLKFLLHVLQERHPRRDVLSAHRYFHGKLE